MIIRSKDEADRLRLTLSSLAAQVVGDEVVVVNDGSSDHTPHVLEEAAAWLPLKIIRHPVPHGRSAASNAGARAASGDILLFLDGDTLAGPELVARHRTVHAAARSLVGRGETYHLRCTRWLQDPQTGSAHSEHAERLARMTGAERDSLRVTREQVVGDFAAIDRRSQPGIYPGASPRRLYELEMDALRRHPDCGVLWAAACGANLSVEREAFLRVGGFDEQIDLTEQRELAYRLCAGGARMVPVDGARTYHMTHRLAWRDPLANLEWEERFHRAHSDPAIKLLVLLWANLSPVGERLPEEVRIDSLPALEAAARSGVDYDGARELVRAAFMNARSAAAPEPGLGAARS